MERVAMEFNKLQYNASLVTNHPLIESSNEVCITIRTHGLYGLWKWACFGSHL